MSVILVVEDESNLRRAYSLLLEDLGHQPVAAENGRQALAAVLSRRPALVLTDIAMPEMDGIELARAMRGGEETAAIPIVAVTGVSDAEYAGVSSRLFDHILRKPLIIEQFVAVLERLLSGSRSGRPQSKEDLRDSTGEGQESERGGPDRLRPAGGRGPRSRIGGG